MKAGYIQQVGTPYELYFNPQNVFVAGFIGEPPMNFVRGKVNRGNISFGDNILDLHQMLPNIADWEGQEIILGFRPEHILLGSHDRAYQVHAQVELTEMLGDNTNIYITAGEHNVILKVDSHDTPETDIDLPFSIPYENVYLFDGKTEEVIPTWVDRSGK